MTHKLPKVARLRARVDSTTKDALERTQKAKGSVLTVRSRQGKITITSLETATWPMTALSKNVSIGVRYAGVMIVVVGLDHADCTVIYACQCTLKL